MKEDLENSVSGKIGCDNNFSLNYQLLFFSSELVSGSSLQE